MPTPEEIEKLAKQYAEFTDLSVVDQLRVKLISKEFLTWVLRDYCVVPKSKVREIYHHIKLELGDGGCSEYQDDITMEKEDLLKSLFGKSLFEE